MKLLWILLADFVPTKHELPMFSVEGRFMHDPSIPRLQSVKWNWPFMCRNLCVWLLVAQVLLTMSDRIQNQKNIKAPQPKRKNRSNMFYKSFLSLVFLWVFLHIKPSSITFRINLSLSPVVGNHLGHEVFCFVCLDVEHLDHGAWNSLEIFRNRPIGEVGVSTVSTTVNKTTQSLEIKMSGSMVDLKNPEMDRFDNETQLNLGSPIFRQMHIEAQRYTPYATYYQSPMHGSFLWYMAKTMTSMLNAEKLIFSMNCGICNHFGDCQAWIETAIIHLSLSALIILSDITTTAATAAAAIGMVFQPPALPRARWLDTKSIS